METLSQAGSPYLSAGVPPLGGFPLLPQPLRTLFGIRADTFDEIARHEVTRHTNAVYVPVDFEPHPAKFAPDSYHPSENSYREFGHVMASELAGRYTTP